MQLVFYLLNLSMLVADIHFAQVMYAFCIMLAIQLPTLSHKINCRIELNFPYSNFCYVTVALRLGALI